MPAAHQATDVLVIGGTGMLRPAVHELAAAGRRVLVVARRPERALATAPTHPGSGEIVPVTADWREPDHLADEVATEPLGPLDEVIVWVHGPHDGRVLAALDRVVGPTATVVQLWGSARAEPSRGGASPPGYGPPRSFRRVVLGFVHEGGRSRWLTDDEISRGALRALQDPSPLQIVGQVEPWSQRP